MLLFTLVTKLEAALVLLPVSAASEVEATTASCPEPGGTRLTGAEPVGTDCASLPLAGALGDTLDGEAAEAGCARDCEPGLEDDPPHPRAINMLAMTTTNATFRRFKFNSFRNPPGGGSLEEKLQFSQWQYSRPLTVENLAFDLKLQGGKGLADLGIARKVEN